VREGCCPDLKQAPKRGGPGRRRRAGRGRGGGRGGGRRGRRRGSRRRAGRVPGAGRAGRAVGRGRAALPGGRAAGAAAGPPAAGRAVGAPGRAGAGGDAGAGGALRGGRPAGRRGALRAAPGPRQPGLQPGACTLTLTYPRPGLLSDYNPAGAAPRERGTIRDRARVGADDAGGSGGEQAHVACPASLRRVPGVHCMMHVDPASPASIGHPWSLERSRRAWGAAFSRADAGRPLPAARARASRPTRPRPARRSRACATSTGCTRRSRRCSRARSATGSRRPPSCCSPRPPRRPR